MSNTISYFREISKIPRESGNEQKISDYLVSFAINRNLEYVRDKYNNVIIFKYVNGSEPVIMQAHMDMVCVSASSYDFNNRGIDVISKEGYLMGNNTSLGADNGIGIAQILNILDNYDYSVEAIFTVSEETTMIGASMIDISMLKGKKLINLDGFNSDTIICECASFNDIVFKSNYNKNSVTTNNIYEIKLDGLPGGHSGADIDKGIPNSIIVLANILSKIDDIMISCFDGGTKFNVIPSTARCIFSSKYDINYIISLVDSEYSNNICIESISDYSDLFLECNDSRSLLESICSFNNGVINTNNGLVTTSHNLGVFSLCDNCFKIGLRSSRISEEDSDISYLKEWGDRYNYCYVLEGRQPGFRTLEESSLISDLKKCNDKAIVSSVHVSLELGFIQEKNRDLEICVISPQIEGAHTVKERVSISSIIECDRWLISYFELVNVK